jgi:hypothetical protein
MQTPSPSSSSSNSSPEIEPRSHVTNTIQILHAASSSLRAWVTPRDSSAAETINLINLPPELISYILDQYLDNIQDTIMLSMTCRHFQAVYNADEKHTVIQQKCRTTWGLLLGTKEFEGVVEAREFVQVLLKWLPYISNEEIKVLSEGLFQSGWDEYEGFFNWLGSFCLDQCLQLIIKHFDSKQTRRFIQKQCAFPLALTDLRCMVRGRYPSFLHYTIASLQFATGDERRGLIILFNLLLERGCDLEQHDTLGRTALNHIFSLMEKRKIDLFQKKQLCSLALRLIRFGADYNARDKKLLTPFIRIIDDLFMVEFFVEHANIAVHGGGTLGEKMLYMAIEKSRLPFIVQTLTEHYKININARNNEGVSFLEHAIMQCNLLAIASLLVEPRIDINAINDRGDSALHYAVKHNTLLKEEFLPIVRMLLRNGIDVNIRNNEGLSALDIAVKYQLSSVIRKLISRNEITSNTCLYALRYATDLVHNNIAGESIFDFILQRISQQKNTTFIQDILNFALQEPLTANQRVIVRELQLLLGLGANTTQATHPS